MRIAILNAWPNLEYSAEREFIARLKLACLKLGWTCLETVTSEDILAADAECVLTTHEYSPKLTHIPTIGLLWSPPGYFSNHPLRVRNILSYDGYLTGGNSVREYLGDLLFSTRKNTPVSDFDFLPTAPITEFRLPNLNNPSLFYTGVHWDGKRHEKLIKALRNRLPISFYGDPAKWARYGKTYKGSIPFDGTSIFDKLNAAGVALCLHRPEHLEGGIPSMRIFEAAAACTVIITEDSSFAKSHFGDSVLYVNQYGSEIDKAEQIIAHFEWVRKNPEKALRLVTQAHSIFNQHFSLETLLGRLPDFLQQVKRAGGFLQDNRCNSEPRIETIIRIGGRDLSFIQRCLDSLAAQTYQNIGLILVSYSDVPGVEDLLKKHEGRFPSVKHLTSEPTGFRSTSLWDGMHVVEGDYFCNLDDDDTIHPNHLSSLVSLLNAHKNFDVAYSGCIQVQDEEGHYYQQVNFRGSLGLQVKENRTLRFLDPFNMQRMLHLENFIVSNAWLARKSVLLVEGILEDPRLIVAEDVYLYQFFLRRGDFLFSWRATANWHWRSTSKDNSTISETRKAKCRERVILRTQFSGLSQNAMTCLDIVRPFVTFTWKKFPRIKEIYHYFKKRFSNERI